MKSITKKSIIYPLILMMVALGIVAVSTEYSYGAESFKVSQGTRWVDGQNINSGLRIMTTDDKIAYCLNQGKASPSGNYSEKLALTGKMKAVLYLGYPNNKKFGSISLSNDQARCATQLAVWAHDESGKGNKINLDKLTGSGSDGDKVLKAAKWIYDKAKSGYKAPTKPSLPAPTFTNPTNTTPQYFNSTYVRVGPYKYTTTNNSYTSKNKVSVSLNGAPSGTKLGDIQGNFISTPTSGADFYVYIPLAKLGQKGSKSFSLSASYEYKYEKSASFSAYKKDSTQNVALSTSKAYATGEQSVNGTGTYNWTTGTLKKTDVEDENKPIPNTVFEVYYDPTPSNTSNNDWKLMYELKTDDNGIINIPGLGIGRYKVREVKSNPDYAVNSEFGESDEIIFNVNDVNKESIQIMNNKKISISCEIDKDTIRKTSAAYKSLPNQEEIDNTGKETYRYNLDYRSTSNVWADEFTVDDHLEGVADNQIRVTELWTSIAFGDYDGKMNVWYKTNKTNDSTDYSKHSGLSTNPKNPNNPLGESVKKNTGFKLWAKDVSTLSRTNLKVSELNLEEDEYITAIRFEHGRVEKGFTTKNYSSESMNDDGAVDWSLRGDEKFYNESCAATEGLKPVTYLVMCPNPLNPPEVINNSADAFIARNLHLTDEDKDSVKTEVIDTFKENPLEDEYPKGVLGQESGPNVPNDSGSPEKTKVLGDSTKTGDGVSFMIQIMLMIVLVAVSLGVLLMLQRRNKKPSSNTKNKHFSVLIIALLLVGSMMISGFANGGLEGNEVHAASVFSKDKYVKKQAQIDKTEIIKNLDSEDITNLPESKEFEVRSDQAIGATEKKTLNRAGISLNVSSYDEDGIPNKWDATIVYRGLEKYIEELGSNTSPKTSKVMSVKPEQEVLGVKAEPSADPFDKETQRQGKKLFLESQGYYVPEDATVEEMEEIMDGGWKTGDIIKCLGLLIILAGLSTLFYFKIWRKKMRRHNHKQTSR